MSSTQQASATGSYLCTPEDALVLLEAARRGLLPRTTRRLTRTERERLIQDGSVFIWEEYETQMQRWTDGKRWSCSRVMGEFLGYEQVLPGESVPGVRTNSQSSRVEGGLIKQTYSTTLTGPDDSIPKKYHIISYHRSQSVESLKRPSLQPFFADMDLSLWRLAPSVSDDTASPPGSSSLRLKRSSQPSSRRTTHSPMAERSYVQHGLEFNVVAPSRRGSTFSDHSSQRPSFDQFSRVQAPFYHTQRHSPTPYDSPVSSVYGGSKPPSPLSDFGDSSSGRYHPYRPNYPPSASSLMGPLQRRANSPTPSLISNSTADSSRCSSPKRSSSLSNPAFYPVVGPGHARPPAGPPRIWPAPSRQPTALGVSLPYENRALPAVDAGLPIRDPSRPAFGPPPSAPPPPPHSVQGLTWHSAPPTYSSLASEDERMLSRLRFRI